MASPDSRRALKRDLAAHRIGAGSSFVLCALGGRRSSALAGAGPDEPPEAGGGSLGLPCPGHGPVCPSDFSGTPMRPYLHFRECRAPGEGRPFSPNWAGMFQCSLRESTASSGRAPAPRSAGRRPHPAPGCGPPVVLQRLPLRSPGDALTDLSSTSPTMIPADSDLILASVIFLKISVYDF